MESKLHLFNTATGRVERFETEHDPVRMYVCGPTTYAPAHLGHAKSYLTFDILRRWLEHSGHRVRQVQNLTDVADETAERALRSGETEAELTQRFARDFAVQMEALGNLPPHRLVPASRVIQLTAQVAAELLERGLAYRTPDEQVYLKAAAEDFGRLLRGDLDLITLEEPEGFQPLGGKRAVQDFLLWGAAHEGWQGWDSPAGFGRPGWHTECYIIATTELGLPLDIHGGGEDLIFPHHESEQLLCHHLQDTEYARFWVHNGLIFDAGGKLSKSRGKHTTLAEIFADCPPHALRYFLLQDHYRVATHFDAGELEAACAEGQRLGITAAEVLTAFPDLRCETAYEDEMIAPLARRYHAALNDDLHTDRAVEVLRELDAIAVKALAEKDEACVKAAAALYRCYQKVLGLFPEPMIKAFVKHE